MSFAVNTSIRASNLHSMMATTISQSQRSAMAPQNGNPSPQSPCVTPKTLLRGTFEWQVQDVVLGGACGGGFAVPFDESKRSLEPPTKSIQFSPITPTPTPTLTKSSKKRKKKVPLSQRIITALSAPPLPMDDGNLIMGLGAPIRQSVMKSPSAKKKPRRMSSITTAGDSCTTATTQQSMDTLTATGSSRLPHAAVRMMSDRYSFMSYRFPVTDGIKKVMLRKRKLATCKNSTIRDIDIESIDGEILGTIEDGGATGEPGIRRLKDNTGRVCAIIKRCFDPTILYGPKMCFRVYGDKPCTLRQERTTDDVVAGTYLWAEVKNVGSIDGTKFAMKRYSTQTESCSVQQHTTKRFGSLFSTGSKGFTILDHQDKECAKIVSLKKNHDKGIVIGPNRDMCLMLAFCAVVDEYVEHRLI